MMSLWEKNKEAVLFFWKERNKSMIMLFCECLSICIASYFFMPFVITDVIEQKIYFVPWYLLGFGAACFGIFGLIYSLFTFGEKKKTKDKLFIFLKVLGIYIGGRLVFAFLAGIVGMVFIRHENDINLVKSLIDRGIQIGMGPLNAFLLLYFTKLLYETSWKRVWENMVTVTILFYSMDILLFLLHRTGSSMPALGIRAIFQACFITGIVLFVLFLLKQEEAIGEKTEEKLKKRIQKKQES
jgi:hypothetical protein